MSEISKGKKEMADPLKRKKDISFEDNEHISGKRGSGKDGKKGKHGGSHVKKHDKNEKDNIISYSEQHKKDEAAGFENSDELYHLMRRCGNILFHDCESNYTQKLILKILSEKGTMAQKELQKMLNVKVGSISEIIGKLESKSYVICKHDENDKRKIKITVTESGRKYSGEKSKTSDGLFEVLTDGEKDELKSLLKKLLDNWDIKQSPEDGVNSKLSNEKGIGKK
jgi:DNA-binding MarR family transcriptional regulator